jgi:hypothetical protein
VVSSMDWTDTLLDQLTYHWDDKARPRLVGLTDDEYLWEPVAGAWSIRPRGEATSQMAAGGGDLVIDFAYPEPLTRPRAPAAAGRAPAGGPPPT